MIFRLPLFVAMACIILTVATSAVGYRVFRRLFEEQYKTITEQIANTALSYINGDSISRYVDAIYALPEGTDAQSVADEEWEETNTQLNMLTETASLAYIYVFIPDENFEKRLYLYDTVHPLVIQENPKIKPIPLGKISSLKSYDEKRLTALKRVMHEGVSEIHFVYTDTGGHVTTTVAIKDSQEKITGILSIVKPMSEIRAFKQRYMRITFGISAGLTIVMLALFIFFLLVGLIKPIVLLTEETSLFSEHKGELTGVLQKIKGKNELSVLARAIEKMVEDIHRYIRELTQATAEKERISAELDVATQIQANMLPRIFPPYQNHPELELFASMKPAKEVGGDLYDFFFIDEDHFAVLVGDVSGKGVPAALFMTIAKTLLKNVGLSTCDPAKILSRVNDQLCEGNDASLFVTCWLGILELSTGKLQYANAGHTEPLLYHDGKVEYLKSPANLMLAALSGVTYQNYELVMNRGDRLFVYTDGITEAMNKNNELYGEERLISAVTRLISQSSKEMLEGIQEDINQFVEDAPQFDDITMLELSLKKLGEEK